MTVNPGFGGQKLIEPALEKLKRIDQALKDKGLREQVLLQVDGGVSKENAQKVRLHGAEILVAGTAVFGENNYAEAIESLR